MQIIDAGMIAFAAWHALKKRIDWPLTFQVPRMLRATLRGLEEPYVLCWNAGRLAKHEKWPGDRDRPEIWDLADAYSRLATWGHRAAFSSLICFEASFCADETSRCVPNFVATTGARTAIPISSQATPASNVPNVPGCIR